MLKEFDSHFVDEMLDKSRILKLFDGFSDLRSDNITLPLDEFKKHILLFLSAMGNDEKEKELSEREEFFDEEENLTFMQRLKNRFR